MESLRRLAVAAAILALAGCFGAQKQPNANRPRRVDLPSPADVQAAPCRRADRPRACDDIIYDFRSKLILHEVSSAEPIGTPLLLLTNDGRLAYAMRLRTRETTIRAIYDAYSFIFEANRWGRLEMRPPVSLRFEGPPSQRRYRAVVALQRDAADVLIDVRLETVAAIGST